MSFTIVCPICDARLTAPDSLEGKRVKCRKCGDPFVARPLDDEEDAPKPRSNSSARPRRAEDDDEDDRSRRPAKASRRDDDDEDRPRRRSREKDDEPKPRKRNKRNIKKEPGVPLLLFVLLGVGAL